MCLRHSEAKQTWTFGAEEGLLQGQARRMGGSCSKNPNSLMGFGEKFLEAKLGVRAAGCVAFFWLVGGEVTGRCSRDLVISLKLPSSTCLGALVPAEELKDIFMYVPWGGTRTMPYAALLFLDCSSFVFAFPPFPDEQLFESALWNSGKVYLGGQMKSIS